MCKNENKKKIVLECVFCKTKFFSNPSIYKKSLKKNKSGNFFCSKACFHNLRSEKLKLEYLKISKKCKNCDNLIPFDKYWKTKKFCSQSCSGSFNNKNLEKVLKSCYFCGCGVLAYSKHDNFRIRCDSCRKEKKKFRLKKRRIKLPCKICGSKFCGSKYGACKNTKTSFLAFFKYFDFDLSTLGSRKVFIEFNKIKAMLYEDYHTNEMSLIDIAKKYKCKDHNLIFYFFNKTGMKRRSPSESMSASILNGKRPVYLKYKAGWHITWEGNRVFYRSSYELKFCEELDEKKIKYRVESMRVKYFDSQTGKERYAIPDFYLPDTNEIIEIKNGYNFDKCNMRDRCIAYVKSGYSLRVFVDFKEFNIWV